MALRVWLGVVVVMGALISVGCGGSSTEEGASAPSKTPPENVKVDMKQAEGGYSVEVKSGSEELKLQAEGSSDDSYSMVVNSKDGEVKMSAGSAAKLPDKLPPDVPTYPGMSLNFSQSMEEKETFTLQASSTDPFDRVAEHFKSEATTKGWTETTSMDQNAEGKRMRMYAGSKEGRALSIILASEETGTAITITTAKQ